MKIATQVLLMTALVCSLAFSQSPIWQPTPLGGSISGLAANKSGSVFVCLHSGYGFAYRSSDDGLHWTQLQNSGSPFNQLIVSLAGDLFASGPGSALYRSTNNGETWSFLTDFGFDEPSPRFLLFDDPRLLSVQRYGLARTAHPAGLFLSSDNGGSWVDSYCWGTLSYHFTDIALNSAAVWGDSVVFVSTASTMYRSIDKGRSFYYLPRAPQVSIRSLASPPGSPVYVVSGNGLFASSDTGKTWTGKNEGLSNTSILSFKIVSPAEYLVGTEGGIFISEDAGLHWSGLGLEQLRINSIVTYHATTLLVATDQGVFLTTDHGANWREINAGLPSKAVSFLTIDSSGYAFVVSGDRVYRTQDMVSEINTVGYSPSPGYFGLAVGNTWFYGARSTPEAKRGLYGVRKQIVDTLQNRFRVVQVAEYYLDTVQIAPTEYWYDDGYRRLYRSWSGNAVDLSYPFYDAMIQRDSTEGPNDFINHAYHLLPLNIFGATLAAQEVTTWYAEYPSYMEKLVTVPEYAFVKSTHTATGSWPGYDSTYLVGMVKDGVVLGDTSLANEKSSVAQAPSERTSTLSASPLSIPANGWSTLVVTMRAKNVSGMDVTTGGAATGIDVVQVENGARHAVKTSNVTDHHDGTYTWVLTSSHVPGSVMVHGLINGKTLSDSLTITFTGPPISFSLEQNYPNPFNSTTTISYGLKYSTKVTLTVYDILGQQVATLVNGEVEAGYHDVQFDGTYLASGIYFYRLQAGTFIGSKKLLLLK